MCRFQSSTVLQLTAFQALRYLLHIDSDASFRCDEGSVDPFEARKACSNRLKWGEEMAKGESVYGPGA